MAITNLRNIVTLGVLKDGVYPDVYNEELGYGQGDIKTSPTIFLYYREDGNLYLYRSKENIEINLTNISAYDATLLFHFTEEDDVDIIGNLPITSFKSENIDSLNVLSEEGFPGCEYNTTWVKPQQQYVYILVPLVHSVSSIFINNIYSNSIFNIVGLYVHDEKSYWIYKGQITSHESLNYNDVENLKIQVFLRTLTSEDLSALVQLEESIKSIDLEHRTWWALLKEWVLEHKKWIDNKLVEVYAKFNDYVTLKRYEEDKESYSGHIHDYNNPHNVTKKQLGLDQVPNDILNIKESISSINELLALKQNISSQALDTDAKNIVGAINEVLANIPSMKGVVYSDSINKIELVTKIPETYEDGILYVRIPYDDKDHCFVTINAIPSNSHVTLTNSEGNVIDGYGSATIECLVQSTVRYVVECDGYETKSVVLQLGHDNVTINVKLEIPLTNSLTINATPVDAIIQLYNVDTDELLLERIGALQYSNNQILNLRYKVFADGYVTKTKTFVFDKTFTEDVVLEEVVPETSDCIIHVLDENGNALNPYIYNAETNGLIGQVENGYYTFKGLVDSVLNIILSLNNYESVNKTIKFVSGGSNETVLMYEVELPKYNYRLYAVNQEGVKIESLKSVQVYDNNSWIDQTIVNNEVVYISEANKSIQVKLSADGYVDQTELINLVDNVFDIAIIMQSDIIFPEVYKNNISFIDADTQEVLQEVHLFVKTDDSDWNDMGILNDYTFDNYAAGTNIQYRVSKEGYNTKEGSLVIIAEEGYNYVIDMIPNKYTTKVTYKNLIDSSDLQDVQLLVSIEEADYVDLGVASEHNLEYRVGTHLRLKAMKDGFKVEEVSHDVNYNTELVIYLSNGINAMRIGGADDVYPAFSINQ